MIKDALVTFSGGETTTLALSNTEADPTVKQIDPAVVTSSIKVEIVSVYTGSNFGLSEVMVWYLS